MQIINNTGAIIKEQINLGDIDNLNIDDLFKNNTSKQMKNNNYPTWLVSLDIAKELKEIGFDEPCHFYYQNDYNEYLKAGDPDKYHIISDSLAANRKNANHNKSDIAISAPAWEQVFEWFREKGFESYIRLESHAHFDEGNYYYFEITKSNLRQLDWQGDFDDYNEAREALVKALIRTYKNEQL